MTSSYLNMDRAVTGCQDIESPVHCNNRKFLDQLLSTCKCFPPNLWDLFDKVGDMTVVVVMVVLVLVMMMIDLVRWISVY